MTEYGTSECISSFEQVSIHSILKIEQNVVFLVWHVVDIYIAKLLLNMFTIFVPYPTKLPKDCTILTMISERIFCPSYDIKCILCVCILLSPKRQLQHAVQYNLGNYVQVGNPHLPIQQRQNPLDDETHIVEFCNSNYYCTALSKSSNQILSKTCTSVHHIALMCVMCLDRIV